jgi:hypothetical protein
MKKPKSKKPRPAAQPKAQTDTLKGWTQIAQFLGQPVAVAQRWARTATCCIAGWRTRRIDAGLLAGSGGNRDHGFGEHADFLRDFRGDTVHPSTLELMHELGLGKPEVVRPPEFNFWIARHSGVIAKGRGMSTSQVDGYS